MSGFQSPNYTQTPNDFFLMIPDMSDAEMRVTLVMIRETFGYHREEFKMGLNKLKDAAGLSRNGAKDGAEAAEKRGTFKRNNPDSQGEAEWSLIVTPSPSDQPGSHSVTTPPSPSDQQVGVKERIKKVKEKDILDGILETQLKPKSIRDSIRVHFKLTPNWETKYNRQFMQWAIEENVTAEQIQHAAKLWGRDKRFNWSPPNLKGIQEHWLKLIEDLSPVSPVEDSSLEERRRYADSVFGVRA